MNRTFFDLEIRPELVEILKKGGLTIPTPVQERTIPMMIAGDDVIAQAQTGTGKTLAFVLPILEVIEPNKSAIQALIVTPTRELAIQITSEIKNLISAVNVRVLAVYGGQDVEGQIHKLKGTPHLIVGTPGRLLDHLRRETIDLSALSMLVLDEADLMLDMGFLSEIEEIIRQTPRQRQTGLFSATMPDQVRRLAANYMRNPKDVRIEGKRVTLEGIQQFVVETTDRGKQRVLIQMIEQYQPFLAVVFCRTKIRAKKLTEALHAHGLNVDELHGDLSQSKREQVMKRFRDAKLQILVATDVAARGLDVEGITHVFNYDIPRDAESYIHRIGRTGRAGHTGLAITLAVTTDRPFVNQIEQGIGAQLERRRVDISGGEPKVENGVGEYRDRRSSGPDARGSRSNKRGTQGRRSAEPRWESEERLGAGRARKQKTGERTGLGRTSTEGSRPGATTDRSSARGAGDRTRPGRSSGQGPNERSGSGRSNAKGSNERSGLGSDRRNSSGRSKTAGTTRNVRPGGKPGRVR